jgi:hypothetical protein
MSRNSTAYFAIVGTLAFALPGAASAGQVNIPHLNLNIPRPQISIPTPHPSVPTSHLSVSPPRISAPTQGLSNLRTQGLSNSMAPPSPPLPGYSYNQVPTANQFGKFTVTGNSVSSPNTGPTGGVSYTGGGGSYTGGGGSYTGGGGSYTGGGGSYTGGGDSYASSGGGGYSTAGKADASPSFRCRSKGGESNCR